MSCRRCLLTTLLAVLVVAQTIPATTVHGAPTSISGDGKRLLAPNGAPLFLLGLNYEGPADRAWEMWNDGKFDVGLIDKDFERAASAGVHALRIFVQAGLARDLADGKWDKLEQVVSLAERRNLQLILSMFDYPEVELAKVAATMGQIAQRFRGRPGILAYDLKNEPRFGDLALTRYPAPVPLQQAGLLNVYGERLARADLAAYRASEEGARTVPAALSDEQAWIYVNYLRLYRELLAEASEWVRGRGYQGTSLDYLDDPAAQKWAPFVAALDASLRAWIQPQVEALHRADPARPVTVGHVDAILAKLPANDLLDYHTLHRYPAPGAGPLRGTLSLLASLRSAHPGRPYVLGEFGYANEKLEPEKTAILETATYLGLVAQDMAGGAKWMLNDMPPGYNTRERTMGAFTREGAPKPLVSSLGALRRYLSTTGSGPGELQLEEEPDAGLRYVYHADDALLLGGKQGEGRAARFAAETPAQLFLTWSEPGLVRLWASAPMQVEARLDELLGKPAPADVRLARVDGGQERAMPLAGREGQSVQLKLEQAGYYVLRLGSARARPADYAIPQGHFFTQTNGRGEGQATAGTPGDRPEGVPGRPGIGWGTAPGRPAPDKDRMGQAAARAPGDRPARAPGGLDGGMGTATGRPRREQERVDPAAARFSFTQTNGRSEDQFAAGASGDDAEGVPAKQGVGRKSRSVALPDAAPLEGVQGTTGTGGETGVTVGDPDVDEREGVPGRAGAGGERSPGRPGGDQDRVGQSAAGFSVTNADGIPFWDAFQELGGVEVLGYPVSRRFEHDGLTVQAFQKAVLQWRPDQGGQVWFLNTFDVLHDQGKDDWLEVYRQTPRPADTAPDTGLPWEKVVERHLAFLDHVPAPLRERFLEDPRWLEHHGLPVATAEYPHSVVVRAQRATFQYWKETMPWARQGEVTVANAGDLAKEAGVWPWLAVTPENAPR